MTHPKTARGDPNRGEHHRNTATTPDDIARDLTTWLAARDYSNQPARKSRTDF